MLRGGAVAGWGSLSPLVTPPILLLTHQHAVNHRAIGYYFHAQKSHSKWGGIWNHHLLSSAALPPPFFPPSLPLPDLPGALKAPLQRSWLTLLAVVNSMETALAFICVLVCCLMPVGIQLFSQEWCGPASDFFSLLFAPHEGEVPNQQTPPDKMTDSV